MSGHRAHVSIGWNQIWDDCKTLSRLIGERYGPDTVETILAVGRGGFIPATILSYLMGVRDLRGISAASYEGNERQEKVLLKGDPGPVNENRLIIVDDIADSGRTMESLMVKYPKARRITLYAKPDGRETVNLFLRLYPQEEWLDFPWEVK